MDAVQELVPAHVVPSSDVKMSPRADTVMVTLLVSIFHLRVLAMLAGIAYVAFI